MSYRLVLRPVAERELEEAYAWYEERRAGLGARFLLAVEARLAAIVRTPKSFPAVHQGIRRALVPRFPYGIHYLLDGDRIVVIAVFHSSRDPMHWQSRA